MYLYSLVKSRRFKHITHTFPVRGHSFLPCDRDFGITEKKKRKMERVYIPEQWIELIEGARRRNPFDIVRMSMSTVLNYQSHLPQYFKNNFSNIRVRDLKMIEYSDKHIDEVWVKYSFSDIESWSKYSIQKPGSIISFPSQTAYTSPVPIKSSKFADLQKIIKKYVPHQYHSYYDSLTTSDTTEPDD